MVIPPDHEVTTLAAASSASEGVVAWVESRPGSDAADAVIKVQHVDVRGVARGPIAELGTAPLARALTVATDSALTMACWSSSDDEIACASTPSADAVDAPASTQSHFVGHSPRLAVGPGGLALAYLTGGAHEGRLEIVRPTGVGRPTSVAGVGCAKMDCGVRFEGTADTFVFVAPSASSANSDASDNSHLSVAPDSSAWGVRQTLRGDRYYDDNLGEWQEGVGWQWHSIPGGRTANAIAALSRTSVWLVLREPTGEPSPYYGGSTLAHWNGSSFDAMRTLAKPLRELVSDGEGGMFSIANDGTLYRASADGALTELGDAGTAGESDYGLCDVVIAPSAGGNAFVLDQLCQLSQWDSATLKRVPGFRTAAHGSGHVSFSLWAASPTSLWLTDPFSGLRHFDGKEWKLVWESQLGIYGIWGVDDDHVWFVDSAYRDRGMGAVLRRWDGTRVRPVASVLGATMFGGGRDTVWLSGSATLRLRATESGRPVR